RSANLPVRGARGATVRACDRVDDREAEPGPSSTAGIVRSAEALERTRKESPLETCAFVGDVELHVAVPCLRADSNGSSAVPESVVHEVSERLPNPPSVDLDLQRGGRVDPDEPPEA